MSSLDKYSCWHTRLFPSRLPTPDPLRKFYTYRWLCFTQILLIMILFDKETTAPAGAGTG